ncbi:MAG: hypothetical protein B6U95_00410 [Thermofilum sp. ex4484_82]|nr:MAG: hypothetical protein B6U95_00410 [Thermofilum sp. ex4484_82]OYT40078.1 MAG: hypothetical protein B6U96_00415 [Archaeoglobales archaeon ex4484_92]
MVEKEFKCVIDGICPFCNRRVHREVILTGIQAQRVLESIRRIGVGPVSIDHEDHVLVAYVDAHGATRRFHAFPKAVVREEIVLREMKIKRELVPLEWKRVNIKPLPVDGLDVLFIDKEGMKYSDAYWSRDIEGFLELASNIKKDIKIGMNNRDFWFITSGKVVYVVENLWNDEQFSKILWFLKRLPENIVEDSLLQAIVSFSMNKFFDEKYILEDVFRMIIDLDRMFNVNGELLTMVPLENIPEKLINTLSTRKGRYTTRILVADILTKSPDMLLSFIKNYNLLKNLKIISG